MFSALEMALAFIGTAHHRPPALASFIAFAMEAKSPLPPRRADLGRRA
jgi:hypothetical protein